MRFRIVLIGLTVITATSTSFLNHAFAQANVNESEPVTLYVSAASGSDSNPGTNVLPLRTIQAGIDAAVVQNRKGLGVKLLVEPGAYREAVTINPLPTSAALTLQAVTPGTAYIDGADVLSNWYAAGNGVYTASWNDSVTGCPLPSGWYSDMPPVALANEMLFINGAMMTQVMSASQLRPGTFYVNTTAKQIEADPPQGTEVSTSQIEVAARRSTLTINATHNLVVRGMVLQHGASCMNTTAATVNSGTNILFDSDVVLWNNWSGLGISTGTDVTVRNTIANYNGGVGLAAFQGLQELWQNNETSYNNWRGAMIGLYDFGQGGTKLMHIHGGTVTGQSSYYNQAQGLWFDTDNINIKISGADLIGNLVGNLQLELSQGPISVENSSMCSGSGVQILESDGISMTGNHFYNNGGTTFQNAQLFVAGKAGGRSVTNWQTNVTTNLITKNMALSGNSFTALGTDQYVFNTYLNGNDWSEFTNSFSSRNNEWYNASNTVDFGIPANNKVSFSSWKGETGQDYNSTWALSNEAETNCTAPKTSYPDFQILAHNAASYVASYSMDAGHVSIPLQIRSFDYGSVSLSVSGLPSGVSSSFSTSSLTSGSSVLTLTAASNSVKRTVPVTIFATSGSRVHSVTVEVAVSPK